MNHNPYTPPSASVAEPVTADAPPPKPRAVTVTQVLGVAFVILFAWGIANYARGILEWRKLGVVPDGLYIGLGIRVSIFLAIIVVLLQLPRRSQIARWCGALLILTLLCVPIYLLASMEPPDSDAPGELLGFVIGFLIMFLPTAYWLYAFAFSRKARAYFRSPARN